MPGEQSQIAADVGYESATIGGAAPPARVVQVDPVLWQKPLKPGSEFRDTRAPRALERVRIDGESFIRYFIHPLTAESTLESFWRGPTPHASAFKLDCIWRRGPSFGVPVDVLGMYARQIIFNRLWGVNEMYALVGESVAGFNPAVARDVDQVRRVQTISYWHQSVAEKIQAYLARNEPDLTLQSVVDRNLPARSSYRTAMQERLRAERHDSRLERLDPYTKAIDVLFEALRLEYGATVKGGWSIQSARDKIAAVEDRHYEVRGSTSHPTCDSSIDYWTRQTFPNTYSYFYGPAAISFASSMPVVSPVLVRPHVKFNTEGRGEFQKDEDGRVVHGRILLHRDEELGMLKGGVFEKGSNLPAREAQRERMNYARAIESLYNLCALVRAAMPGLRIDGGSPEDLREIEMLEKIHGSISSDLRFSRRDERERARLEAGQNSAWLSLNEARRKVLLPELAAIISEFAWDGR